jgi:hypothetical protein
VPSVSQLASLTSLNSKMTKWLASTVPSCTARSVIPYGLQVQPAETFDDIFRNCGYHTLLMSHNSHPEYVPWRTTRQTFTQFVHRECIAARVELP